MSEVVFIKHSSCTNCGSSDGNALYSDGHCYCFVCGAYTHPEGAGVEVPTTPSGLIADIEFKHLSARNLKLTTCKRYSYGVGSDKRGTKCQVATYFDSTGVPVAQKLRYKNKDFSFIGQPKQACLFGQQLFSAGGKKVTITEGEIDALSVAQAFNCKYPVVSVPNGSNGAKRSLSKQLEWLNSFEEIILWFDNDDAGRAAVAECVDIFPAGKVKIVQHPNYKDANELLLAEGESGIIDAFYKAKEYRPDGILTPAELISEISKPVVVGIEWCFDKLTQATYGRRLGEIYAFGAGTGCGKTDLLTQQIAYDIMKLNIRCGVFFLEQMPSESLRRIAGKIDGKLYHIPSSENNKWSQEGLNNTVQKIVNTDNLYLYNNFGSTDWEVIQSKIRYMAHSLGVKHIYIDHLTALASHAQDERRFLDGLMEEMASLAQELNIIIHFVSHLATPQGVAHEEGGRVMAKHFRGSRSIQQWSYFMFGLERNQQATDPDERRRSLLRVLKDRHTGQSNGLVIPLSYDLSTGLLKEVDETFDSVESFGAEPYDGEDY